MLKGLCVISHFMWATPSKSDNHNIDSHMQSALRSAQPPRRQVKMTGGTLEVRSDKSLTLMTFNI